MNDAPPIGQTCKAYHPSLVGDQRREATCMGGRIDDIVQFAQHSKVVFALGIGCCIEFFCFLYFCNGLLVLLETFNLVGEYLLPEVEMQKLLALEGFATARKNTVVCRTQPQIGPDLWKSAHCLCISFSTREPMYFEEWVAALVVRGDCLCKSSHREQGTDKKQSVMVEHSIP